MADLRGFHGRALFIYGSRDDEAVGAPEFYGQYCREHGIAVLVRGPLAMGLLSGRYNAETVFPDSVRGRWHTDEARQEKFLADVAKVDRLKQAVAPGEEMVAASLRFAISGPARPVAIPGATASDALEAWRAHADSPRSFAGGD